MNSTTTADNVSHTITMLSYNSTGWGFDKIDFIRTILLAHGILVCAVQEHFMLKDNLHKLECFDNYEVFTVPAFKNNNRVSRGRPSGGLSFFYSHTLSKYATRLNVPNSRRVQGLKLDMPNASFLLINAYFPNDPGNNNLDDTDLLNTLQDINYLLDMAGDNCTVVLMGDLNTDFARNTPFVNIVQNFFQENNLVTSWSKFDCDFTFYQERTVRGQTIVSKSTIDHFSVRFEDLNSCLNAMPIHMAENFSFHAPIYLKFECNITLDKHNVSNEKLTNQKRPQWHKASKVQINKYSQDLSEMINNVVIDNDVLCCTNVHCKSEHHKVHLEDLCHNVLDAVTSAVRDNIPTNSSCSAKVIPGWTDSVQPYKERSIFWKAVWESAGRPIDTELHRVMKHTRNQFHYAVRKVKRHEAEIRRNKFIDACLNNKVSDILQEIKATRSKNTQVPSVIDGFNTSEDIANNFRDIYSNIYNTHNDRAELDEFIEENNNNISQSDIELVDKITPEMVKRHILKFSNSKNDSLFDWKSDALKAGVDSLAAPLCDLLRSLITHGHIPNIFLMCSLVPIVKDKKASKMSSSNYRLIAITALVLKLFDHILIELSQPHIKPSNHQFGFQSGLSTGLCTWSLTETINYFRNRDTPVFLCLMDLTKAFDLVKLSLLFRKLRHKVAPILIRFLIFSYIHQECVVSWNGVRSSSFNITNGVRQGAVLSPALFNIYIDEVFSELSNSGFGCKINNLYFGCFGYADDIALVAPCREALQQMVNICKGFFAKHGIKISTDPNPTKTKTKVLVYGVNSVLAPIVLGDKILPYVNTWKHLGHTLCTDENAAHDMTERRREFIGKLHSLQQELGSQDPTVMMKLIQTYLLHLYGCQLWDIYSEDIIVLWSTWHRTIKATFNLPIATHRYLLNDIVNVDHVKKRIIKRFVRFSMMVAASNDPNIKLLHQCQKSDWRSVYGRNTMNICREAGVNCMAEVDVDSIEVNPLPIGEEWRVGLLGDLLRERENSSGFLNQDQLSIVMDLVCTN